MSFYLYITLMDLYVFINHKSRTFQRWALEEIPPFLHLCSWSLNSQLPHCHFYFYSNSEWNMASFFSMLLKLIFFIYTSFSLFLINCFYYNFIFLCQYFVYLLIALLLYAMGPFSMRNEGGWSWKAMLFVIPLTLWQKLSPGLILPHVFEGF